jgi:RNA-splicing ligase RtcB
MSYCRFENTFPDLRDCLEALGDKMEVEKMSESEKKYAKKMLWMMAEFLLNEQIIEAQMSGDFEDSFAEIIDDEEIKARIDGIFRDKSG